MCHHKFLSPKFHVCVRIPASKQCWRMKLPSVYIFIEDYLVAPRYIGAIIPCESISSRLPINFWQITHLADVWRSTKQMLYMFCGQTQSYHVVSIYFIRLQQELWTKTLYFWHNWRSKLLLAMYLQARFAKHLNTYKTNFCGPRMLAGYILWSIVIGSPG